jgi:uncharacterized protein (TIGR02246 family)
VRFEEEAEKSVVSGFLSSGIDWIRYVCIVARAKTTTTLFTLFHPRPINGPDESYSGQLGYPTIEDASHELDELRAKRNHQPTKECIMRVMTSLALALITLTTQFGLAQEAAPNAEASPTKKQSDETSPELAAIRDGSQAFVEAFNQHDAKAVAALWTEDGEYIDDSGTTYVGRESIEQLYSAFFAENANVKMRLAIDSLRLLNGNVAIEDGRALVDPAPAGAPGVSKYTAVHVKVDGKWRMASVRDSWTETPVTRESIADLGWLIGNWVAEEHGNRSESVFRWVANGNFVARTHTTTQVDGTTTSGIQLIGWNPIEGRVQSWNFSADGGHAVGAWSLTQSGWTAKMNGVTGDGTPMTSVNRLTRLDDNAYVWQSTERTLGGISLPDTDEVVIKRVSNEK